MEAPDRQLPLFPLHAVLFPTMVLPIRIFEERYKAMLRACLDSDSRFGVVLIKEGHEVGAPAVPYEVGTIARIRRVTPIDDGQFNLSVMGERRFHILETIQREPYIKATVRFHEEQIGNPSPTPEEIGIFRQILEQYIRTLLGLRGGWVREVSAPTDPVALSFYTAAVLRGDNIERQRILEASTARERLTLLTPLLHREHQRTRAVLEERIIPSGATLN